MKVFLICTIVFIFSSEINSVSSENSKVDIGIVRRVQDEGELICDSSSNWQPLTFNDKPLKDVCIQKQYQNIEPPNKNGQVPLYYFFQTSRILEVNEKKKTIEVDVKLKVVWEEPRIRAKFLDGKISLPSITKYKDPFIWTPFQSYYIFQVKNIKYLQDPIRIGLISLYSKDFYQNIRSNRNNTLVGAWIEWHITVSCDFDFVLYPFDVHKCELGMIVHHVNATHSNFSYPEPVWEWHEWQGFNFFKNPLDEKASNGSSKQRTPYSNFGLQIKMERLVRPYVYQYFLPCISIVLVSFMSFVVPLSAIPGRVALVVTQCLTLTNIFIHQRVRIELLT